MLLLSLFFSYTLVAQDTARRECNASRTTTPIKIDGNLNEAAWQSAPLISGFTENRPVAGRKQRDELKTEVRVLYDNTALYIGAVMHDVSADSISREIAQRDQGGRADYFMVFLDTYNTGINGFGFMVTSANAQFDARYSNDNNGEDVAWNAVWESAVKHEGSKWMAEISIPYSALRFAKKDVQQWGINFLTRRIKSQQDFFWNPINPVKSGFVNQWGVLNGITNIKPPVRLSLSPYFSSYANHYPYNVKGQKNTSFILNGGMDLKYGINESFTLDMTLIPDFGQVQSDNNILNLTPFEVKYNENRTFFTEGTELFNKGGLFYSRRVGGTPINHDIVQDSLSTGDKVLSNPTESKLINATKISGRTKKGLGVGIFNALTENMYAVIENANGQRKIQTAPLTNYNIVVVDQSLKNNSSVTLINTNVQRAGRAYSADVTSGLFNLFTKKNLYNLNGQYTVSQRYANGKDQVGANYKISAGKSSGKFTASVSHSLIDNKYDPNDLGILFNNNQIDDNININYSIVKPGKWYNSLYSGAYATYSQRYLPRTYQTFITGMYISGNLKNLWNVNANIDWNPVESNDFYEPRKDGRTFISPAGYTVYLNINSSRTKRYSFYLGPAFIRKHNGFNGFGYDITYDHNYRFNNKFSLGQTITYSPRRNFTGYVTTLPGTDSIIFGKRNINTIEHILSGKYTFSSRMGITIRVRHYFSDVAYARFFLLNQAGRLDNTSYNANNDINFNIFNVDCVYSWWLGPGSQISLTWKNFIQASGDKPIPAYFTNLHNTLQAPQQNSLSFKILYYIDYLKLHERFGKKH